MITTKKSILKILKNYENQIRGSVQDASEDIKIEMIQMQKARLEKKQELGFVELISKEYTFRATGGFILLYLMINFLILINVLMIICN